MKATCLDCGRYHKVECPICCSGENIVRHEMYTPEGVSECNATEMQRHLCLDGLGCWCEVSDIIDIAPKGMIDLIKSDGGPSSYYDLPPNCDTVQDLIEAYGMDFSRANILKAVIRWDNKPDLAYNLRKIIWFANDKLKRLPKEECARNATKTRS